MIISDNGKLSGSVELTINVKEEQQETTLDTALEVIANEVLKGTYGNGEDRKNAIYKAVQSKVNELQKGGN